MLLWIGLGVMSAAVLAALLRPLLRTGPAGARAQGGDATAIYRDQLAEIDAERERGLIGAAEAEAARTEIARRLLASAEASDKAASEGANAGANTVASEGAPASRRAAGLAEPTLMRLALGLAAGLPLIAILTYMSLGAPGLPGQPLSARAARPVDTARVDELIRAVELRLRDHPEDGQGWDVIAPVYMKQGRYGEAADAFARATRLLGESAKRLAGFAESTVLASDGIVTEPARLAYEKLARLEPSRVEPKFWLALAKEQDGELKAAASDYRALLEQGPKEATWRPLVEERLATVNEKLGVAPQPGAGMPSMMAEVPLPQLPALPPPAAPGAAGQPPPATTTLRGPTPEDIKAADRLSTADRRQMIEGMVASLADRLKANGRDLQGWERLIRAYSVMGRRSDAIAALGTARKNFTDEPGSLAALADLARSLGLES